MKGGQVTNAVCVWNKQTNGPTLLIRQKVDTFFSAKPNRTNDHHQWWWWRSLIQLKIICGVSCSANKHCVNCRHWIFPSNEKFQCLKIKTKQIQQQRQIGGCGLEFHSKQNKHWFQDGWILFPLKKFDQQLCEQKMGNFLWFFHFFSWSIFFSFSGFIVSGFLKKRISNCVGVPKRTNHLDKQNTRANKTNKQTFTQPTTRNEIFFNHVHHHLCNKEDGWRRSNYNPDREHNFFRLITSLFDCNDKNSTPWMTRTRKWLESLMNLKVNEKLREKWQSFFSYNQWMNLANVFHVIWVKHNISDNGSVLC